MITNAIYYYQDGWTALIAASKEGHGEIVSALLEYGAKHSMADLVCRLISFLLIHTRLIVILVCLKFFKPSKHSCFKCWLYDFKGGWTPLVWASYKGHYGIVHELLHYGANPCERGQVSCQHDYIYCLIL